MRLGAMEKAAYMPDKHSTFIRSRFVLVSNVRHVPGSMPLTSAASRPILMRDIWFMRPVHSGNKQKDWCDPERFLFLSSLGGPSARNIPKIVTTTFKQRKVNA